MQHPNIVQIYEIGEEEGRPFFSMEFVEGKNLIAHIGNNPQPARDAAQLIATLARAMQVAHQRGIIHRDLKPGERPLGERRGVSPTWRRGNTSG